MPNTKRIKSDRNIKSPMSPRTLTLPVWHFSHSPSSRTSRELKTRRKDVWDIFSGCESVFGTTERAPDSKTSMYLRGVSLTSNPIKHDPPKASHPLQMSICSATQSLRSFGHAIINDKEVRTLEHEERRERTHQSSKMMKAVHLHIGLLALVSSSRVSVS